MNHQNLMTAIVKKIQPVIANGKDLFAETRNNYIKCYTALIKSNQNNVDILKLSEDTGLDINVVFDFISFCCGNAFLETKAYLKLDNGQFSEIELSDLTKGIENGILIIDGKEYPDFKERVFLIYKNNIKY